MKKEVKVKNREVRFPIIQHLGISFFFIANYIFAREEGSDDYLEFIFPEDIDSIATTQYALEVFLKDGTLYFICGGPQLVSMYAILASTKEE